MKQATPSPTRSSATRSSAKPGRDGASALHSPQPGAVLQRQLAEMAQAAPVGQAGAGSALPAPLRAGLEALSGLDLGGVQLHRQSALPARLGALAFAQGQHIHLAPGQDRHLPHEAWHVVQQAQGRVRPTLQTAGGQAINDDPALEHEAEQMGARAALGPQAGAAPVAALPHGAGQPGGAVIQGYFTASNGVKISDGDAFSVHPDGHTLFATPAAVDTANNALTAAGALVRLSNQGAPVAAGRTAVAPTFSTVGLARKLDKKYERLSNRQGPEGSFRSFADCFQTSTLVSGVHSGNAPRQNAEVKAKMQLARLGDVPIMGQREGSEARAVDAGARAACSFFRAAFPDFGKLLAETQPHDPLVARLNSAERIDFPGGQVLYKAIMQSPHCDAFVSAYGINEQLAPQIGTAFVNVGDAPEASAVRAKGGEMWNMHWAGVVLVDGTDYVTLENFALELEEVTPEDLPPNDDFLKAEFNSEGKVTNYELAKGSRLDKTDLINDKWGFHMYGKAADSFHGVAGSNKKATKINMTLPMARG